MTKRTTTGALLVIGALVAAACGDGVLPSGPDFDGAQIRSARADVGKVDVCHNGKMIRVNANSAHVGHGDTVGSCAGGGAASIGNIVVITFTDGVFISVNFTSTNCSSGNSVLYQLLNVGGSGSVVAFASFSFDGLHNLGGVPVSGDDSFIVQADCDGGANPTLFETVSASFP